MEKLLSVKQLADVLGLSPHTIYRLVARHLIPVQRIRRRVLFTPARIEQWLASQPEARSSVSLLPQPPLPHADPQPKQEENK